MGLEADYIIVGQGLAGSALAMELLRRGREVVVIDEPANNRSSAVSAGICNPITGRAMSKTYLADQIFPFVQQWYPKAEDLLGATFFHPVPIYRPFLSEAEREEWTSRSGLAEFQNYAEPVAKGVHGESLNDPHGGLLVRQSAYVNVIGWMHGVRDLLQSRARFREEQFLDGDLEVGSIVRYKDIRARGIVFCRGLAEVGSNWFGKIPLRPLKGETLIVRMKLPRKQVISRGVYIVPYKEPDQFVVGSTYEHQPFQPGVTPEGRSLLLERLGAVINAPVDVIHQDWGIRPTVVDRRPILGHHPAHPNLIIFNGLGTKGVSLSPYFASVLADWMEKGVPMPKEVNISRFNALYSD
jgi:glycine oxidase